MSLTSSTASTRTRFPSLEDRDHFKLPHHDEAAQTQYPCWPIYNPPHARTPRAQIHKLLIPAICMILQCLQRGALAVGTISRSLKSFLSLTHMADVHISCLRSTTPCSTSTPAPCRPERRPSYAPCSLSRPHEPYRSLRDLPRSYAWPPARRPLGSSGQCSGKRLPVFVY